MPPLGEGALKPASTSFLELAHTGVLPACRAEILQAKPGAQR
ncbi:hypothetical protein [Moorella sp. E306M]|nr:hypothetical protein [Moorella sp. E306M]